MATETELLLSRALHDSQNQYVYFLLGAAGAAIALAVNQTSGLALSWSQIPLGLAVACWGASFYFGCRNRAATVHAMRTTASLFDVQAGRHPVTGANRELIAAGAKSLQAEFDAQSALASRSWVLQFRLLISGAVLYVVWHVAEMAIRAHA
jgi:hypothetical protein